MRAGFCGEVIVQEQTKRGHACDLKQTSPGTKHEQRSEETGVWACCQ